MKSILQHFPILILFLLFHSNIEAQSFPRLDVPFIVDDSFLSNALVGGLSAPQFSAVDLNGDGTEDLYVFDRHGNVSMTFLWDENISNYKYAPEYLGNFPDMNNWVLLRDFNNDGIQDIFTQDAVNTISGAKVYKGKMENGKIAFDALIFNHEFAPILTYNITGDSLGIINIGTAAYPGVDDIDGDGDLDVMIPSFDGSHIYLFENQTVELNVSPDEFPFILADDCWGDFYVSSMSEAVNLSANTNDCATAFAPEATDERVLHNGNALLTIDMNNDGDKELILGDITTDNLLYLENGGTVDNAWMIAQDTTFPNYDVPAIFRNYISPFYLDVDGDDKKDLIAATTQSAGTSNVKTAWFYKNVESNEQPRFELQRQDFLGRQMIDIGAHASPTFVDYNADGLFDMVLSNSVNFGIDPTTMASSGLYLFENLGTAEAPIFELKDRDWLDLAQYNNTLSFFKPTFGDLDNDGDLDILIGEKEGTLLYAENIAGAGNPMEFADIEFNWQGIDVGKNSAPQLVDINRDGALDLVIGERTGNVNYLPNQGTAEAPSFHPNPDEAPNNFFFGKINTIIPSTAVGLSDPLVVDFGDEFNVFVGSLSGELRRYGNVDGEADTEFTLIDNEFGDFYVGVQTASAILDIDNDGDLEMFVGNARGGLTAFQTNLSTSGMVPVSTITNTNQVSLSPNPTTDFIQIEWTNPSQEALDYAVFDTFGRLVQSGVFSKKSKKVRLDLTDLPVGGYFIRMILDGEILVKTVMKQ